MTVFHIDTDMGVDDSLALALASNALGPSLIAVSTVFGNVDVGTATRNARIFRRLLGREGTLPILSGAAAAYDGFVADARHIHGLDGLGGATSSIGTSAAPDAADRDLESVAEAPLKHGGQKITLVGLGPATNVQNLVRYYGRDNIERIILMSGAFLDRGNITPQAEFNAYCDPQALLLTLSLGIPVTIVPLDIARKVQLSRATVSGYSRHDPTPLVHAIVKAHMDYMTFYRKWEGFDGCFPHDAIAFLAAINPHWFHRVPAQVSVDINGARGATSFIFDASSHVSIAFGGELRRVRKTLSSWGALQRTGHRG